ncbi:MAG: BMP family ABC transporter substrate-binding protein [Olsenella sp.]|nr:BMP family ABC transporter substrate-binding protein [Olsenella sp.]MCI1667145.1 BMP family ABC transporter substrate-binding protein [Olsenella sp.]MCI1793662.1 BMP family ABC transporter substrate-binding protein [Olsenella sp.]MCI1811925.1 BMP family ABC transporter substrate-binding protein [Olsenella sp.]MCI1879028.1 BMP family ABC transporter substrate-binding protein [Olsenella sp.]
MPDQSSFTRRGFLKGLAGTCALGATGALVGCGGSSGGPSTSGDSTDSGAMSGMTHKVEMVTDTGGVNDQSFNQISWSGLQQLQQNEGWDVSYLESKQEADYATNLDKAVDDDAELVWAIGFAMAEAVGNAAKANPDVQFGIIDNANPTGASNITGVQFRAQESSFLVGYIAACVSKTGKVGNVLGVESDVLRQFEFGYKAGVAYANKDKGLNVQSESQYAESFGDAAKGSSITQRMVSNGCDVVFQAAGGTGVGVINACKDAGIYAIGVDMDQSYLAEGTVLTSALKKVDVAIVDVSKRLLSGELEGGTDIILGLSDGAVGIPEDHSLMGDDVYNDAMAVAELIKSGAIVPPATSDDYDKFVASL